MTILTKSQLIAMREHRYSSEGAGFLTFYETWCLSIAAKVPRRLTANAITIIGLSSVMIPCVLASFYRFIGDIESSQTTAYFCVIGFLMWLFCDGIDGIVARRNGQCSAFGEFLDHGGDAFALLFSAVTMSCFLGVIENPFATFLWVFSEVFVNYVSEPYTIHVCRKKKFESFDFNEILTLLSIISFISATYGFEVWKQIILPSLGLTPVHIICGIKVIVIAEQIFSKPRDFYQQVRKDGKPIKFAVTPVVPVLVIFLAAMIAFLGSSQEFIQQNALLVTLCFSFSVIKIHMKLMTAYMSKTEMEIYDASLLFATLTAFGFLICKTPESEKLLTIVSLIGSASDAVIYWLRLLHQIYHAFDVTLFILEPNRNTSHKSLNALEPRYSDQVMPKKTKGF